MTQCARICAFWLGSVGIERSKPKVSSEDARFCLQSAISVLRCPLLGVTTSINCSSTIDTAVETKARKVCERDEAQLLSSFLVIAGRSARKFCLKAPLPCRENVGWTVGLSLESICWVEGQL